MVALPSRSIDLLSSLVYTVTFQVSRSYCGMTRLLIAEPQGRGVSIIKA
jgi:hypothetical protein